LLTTKLRRGSIAACVLLGASAVLAQSYNIQTVAGTTRLQVGALATTVPLRSPSGVASDANGVIYIADQRDNRILKVGTDGKLTILAGDGTPGFSGDNGPALQASLNEPRGLKLDGNGGLYVADYGNNRVRKIDLAKLTITTVAGNGDPAVSGDKGPAVQAGMSPWDIAVDSSGNLYIAEYDNNRVRKVNASDQTITTLAGNGVPGFSGDNNPATSSILDGPQGISVDSAGAIYFVDYWNFEVRKIDPKTGLITAFAGDGFLGVLDGVLAVNAPLPIPIGTAVEANGNILILNVYYVQRVTVKDGILHNIGGSVNVGYSGDGGVTGVEFAFPEYITAAANGDILIADTYNYRVRRIRGGSINSVAGTTIADNIPAATAFLNGPSQAIPNGKGGFLIVDTGDSRIRAVSAGTITNVAGTGVLGSDPGEFGYPQGIAQDALGNMYVADTYNDRVVMVNPGGKMTVVAGTGQFGYSGDHATAVLAKLAGPTSVAVDSASNVYIVDSGNCVIRMVDASQIITTFAGSGTCLYGGDNRPALQAGMSPIAVALDGAGNLLVAEDLNNRIRKINLSTKIITTVAGVGTAGTLGDNGLATSAQLDTPEDVAVDAAGDIFIADWGNSRVRMIKGSNIYTIAGTGNPIFDVESGAALGVSISPLGVSVDTDGTVLIADAFNDRIRRLTPAVPATLTTSSGTQLNGPAGGTTTVSVKVTDASGTPVAGVTVNYTVASGTAQLSSASATTDVKGIATIQVTLGSTVGTVKITATSSGLGTVTFTIAVVAAGPQISTGGIEGAGLSVPPLTTLSSGGIASLFGSNFGAGTFQKVGPGDLVNGKVPTNFHGICVDLSGTRAPVFGASDTQVNFQVPTLSAGSSVTVRLLTGCGTSTESASAGATVQIAAASPEFFYFSYSTDGHNPVAATDSITGAYLGSGTGFVPAQPSGYATVYGTGFGSTNPAVAPGDFPPNLAGATGIVRVLLNGTQLPAPNVLYAGVTPFSPGLYQLNLLLPDDTPNGDLSLVLEVAGVQSPAGAYLTVKK
jgi:trimeric autotransporter adhesin